MKRAGPRPPGAVRGAACLRDAPRWLVLVLEICDKCSQPRWNSSLPAESCGVSQPNALSSKPPLPSPTLHLSFSPPSAVAWVFSASSFPCLSDRYLLVGPCLHPLAHLSSQKTLHCCLVPGHTLA